LSRQLSKRGAGIVFATDLWRQVDLAAGQNHAKVQLVILVTHQLLVEEADFVEDPAPVRRESRGVGVAFVSCQAEHGVADAHRRAPRGPDGSTDIALRYSVDWTADTPCLRMGSERVDRTADEIRRVLRMASQPGDDLPRGGQDAGVH